MHSQALKDEKVLGWGCWLKAAVRKVKSVLMHKVLTSLSGQIDCLRNKKQRCIIQKNNSRLMTQENHSSLTPLIAIFRGCFSILTLIVFVFISSQAYAAVNPISASILGMPIDSDFIPSPKLNANVAVFAAKVSSDIYLNSPEGVAFSGAPIPGYNSWLKKNGFSSSGLIYYSNTSSIALGSLDALIAHKTIIINGLPRNLYVVVFRGTKEVGDIKMDVRVAGQKWTGASPITAYTHAGFFQYVMAMVNKESVSCPASCVALPFKFQTVISNNQIGKSSDLFLVVGHSLGGAAATLYATQLFDRGIPAANLMVYTYGAPAVGDQAFQTKYNNTVASNFHRIRNFSDPVPNIAPKWLHLGNEHVFLGDRMLDPQELKQTTGISGVTSALINPGGFANNVLFTATNKVRGAKWHRISNYINSLEFYPNITSKKAVKPTILSPVEKLCITDVNTGALIQCNGNQSCELSKSICMASYDQASSLFLHKVLLQKVYSHTADMMIGLNRYLIGKGLVKSTSSVTKVLAATGKNLGDKVGKAIKGKIAGNKTSISEFVTLPLDVAYAVMSDYLLRNEVDYAAVRAWSPANSTFKPFSRNTDEDIRQVFNWWSQLAYTNMKGLILAQITGNPLLAAKDVIVGDLLVLGDVTNKTYGATKNALKASGALLMTQKYGDALYVQRTYDSLYYKAKGIAAKTVVLNNFDIACAQLQLSGGDKALALITNTFLTKNNAIRDHCSSIRAHIQEEDYRKIQMLKSIASSGNRVAFGKFMDYFFPAGEKVNYMRYFDSKNFDVNLFLDATSNSQIATILRRSNTYRLPLEPYNGGTLFRASSKISKQYATYLSVMGSMVVGTKMLNSASDNTYNGLLKKAKIRAANLTGAALPITRAAFAKLVVTTFNLNAKVSSVLQADYRLEAAANSTLWTYESIVLRELGAVAPNRSFNPAGDTSRFEALIILNNTMDILTCHQKGCELLDIAKGIY